MANAPKKLLVVQAASLGYDLLTESRGSSWHDLEFRPLAPCFPGLTCTAQAQFRTASPPASHGMIANGLFFRDLRKVMFWEQAASLVTGPRIWDSYRADGHTVGMLFWQQSLGEAVDAIVSPQPIHKHGGGMVQSCNSRPGDLYEWLCSEIGSSFDLKHYWGPLASHKSSHWITEATAALLQSPDRAPDLCLTYLPALEYDPQRYGPSDSRTTAVLTTLFDHLDRLYEVCRSSGREMLVFGDYALADVPHGPIYPNRALREAGLFSYRTVKGMWYPDFHNYRSFAMVDHEIAHIYVRDPDDRDAVRKVISSLDGIEAVLDSGQQHALRVAHSNSGEFLAIAKAGYWIAYPWWDQQTHEPDYARHIDIHNKPGYDPCELFFGWPPLSVTRDATRVRGSHARSGPDRRACWASTCELNTETDSLESLAAGVGGWLTNSA